ncbi:50S ribosomal protein L10, partial [Eggerthella lenta]|nr:50S ribosomal protein L10 [Eggerthella lenta]
KAVIIEAVKARADKASFAVITDFKGMTVEELTNLRVSLRNAGGEYLVVKNTLARIALTDGTHTAIKDKFHDNCGVAFGFDDPVAVA